MGTGNTQAWGLQHRAAKATRGKRGRGDPTQLLQEKDTLGMLLHILENLRKSLLDVKLRKHGNVFK